MGKTKRQRQKQEWSGRLLDLVSKTDMFGTTLNLNVEGVETFRSVPGAILTILLWSIMLQQGLNMFNDLVNYGNIRQSQFDFYDVRNLTERNLLENRQEIVFGFKSHQTGGYEELDPRLGYFQVEQATS